LAVAIIADTGPLYSLADKKDPYHRIVASYVASVEETIIVPSQIMPEVCYLLLESIGTEAELSFLRALTNRELAVEHFTEEDSARAVEILEKYRDAEFGVVDATVMAMAERLKIKTILTLDRRDFSLFRPRHCDAFTLVPDLPPARK
jgi:hypothetical protein